MSTSIIFPMIRNFFNIATGFTSPVKILLSGSSTETCTDLCITCPKTLRRCQHTWLGSITDSMHINLSKLWGTVEDRGTWHALVYGVAKNHTEWLKNINKQHTNPQLAWSTVIAFVKGVGLFQSLTRGPGERLPLNFKPRKRILHWLEHTPLIST